MERRVASAPAGDAVRRQVEKIAASECFVHAERMTRFLRLAVEYALGGRAGELKEYLIGVEVFDRKPSFDPRYDPIVRVEARRLRAKLQKYYETEGSADSLLIELPKGSYAPVFRERGAVRPAPPAPRWRGAVAVLPFSNLSPDPDNDYFSDGLTEELIHQLTKVPGLRVVGWTSAAQLKGRQDVRQIREQLDVGTAVCGSVRKSGGRLRITAQLIDTADGCYLWSETYDREMHDLFAIQEEIAWAVVKALRLKLSTGPAAPRVQRGVRNVEAYDLYLRGRFYWNLRTPEGLRKSIECFEEAAAREPGFALALAAAAESYGVLAEYGLIPPSEAMSKASEAAAKALEYDPELAEAHTALALIRSVYEWNWDEGERCYRRALELNPGYATAHHWFATDFLALRARWEEARAEIEIARQLDPLSPIIAESKAFVDLLSRRYERAAEGYRELLYLHPSFYRAHAALGRAYTQMGRYEEAAAMLEKAHSLSGDVPNVIAALGQTYAAWGRREKALEMLARLTSIAARAYVSSTSFAILHTGLGEKERALEWLERGCERRDLSLTTMAVHPVYDSLRGEPRFQALLTKMGLA